MVTPCIVDVADLDRTPLDLVLGIDDVDVIAVFVAQHGALREQRRGRRAGLIFASAKPPGRIAGS